MAEPQPLPTHSVVTDPFDLAERRARRAEARVTELSERVAALESVESELVRARQLAWAERRRREELDEELAVARAEERDAAQALALRAARLEMDNRHLRARIGELEREAADLRRRADEAEQATLAALASMEAPAPPEVAAAEEPAAGTTSSWDASVLRRELELASEAIDAPELERALPEAPLAEAPAAITPGDPDLFAERLDAARERLRTVIATDPEPEPAADPSPTRVPAPAPAVPLSAPAPQLGPSPRSGVTASFQALSRRGRVARLLDRLRTFS